MLFKLNQHRRHQGDVVVVPDLGSLGRSLSEVVRCAWRIAAAGAGLRSLAEAIDTTWRRAEPPPG